MSLEGSVWMKPCVLFQTCSLVPVRAQCTRGSLSDWSLCQGNGFSWPVKCSSASQSMSRVMVLSGKGDRRSTYTFSPHLAGGQVILGRRTTTRVVIFVNWKLNAKICRQREISCCALNMCWTLELLWKPNGESKIH